MRRAAWLLALVAAGCGYRFTAGGSPLPEGIRTVCVPVFSNQTAEPGLEVVFTQALRERLVRAGTAGGRESCMADITGEVTRVSGNPTVLTNQGLLASYRLYATAHLKLVKGGRVLSECDVSGWEDYLPDATQDILVTEANRQAALQRLAELLMRDGYERLASGW